jgi:hypothetical protein
VKKTSERRLEAVASFPAFLRSQCFFVPSGSDQIASDAYWPGLCSRTRRASQRHETMPAWQIIASGIGLLGAYDPDMDTLAINISWEFFLSIFGSLIAIAYYTNGRFMVLETDVGWLKHALAELLITAENVRSKLFKHGSPVSLTAAGFLVLQRSGLKSYIDAKRENLLLALHKRAPSDPYELERRAFHLLATLQFEEIVAQHLNTFAYRNGISTHLLRRVAAIYLRDIATNSK